jgi:lactoylglutathione lyase
VQEYQEGAPADVDHCFDFQDVAFYRDLLGFAETYRFPPGDAAEFVALSLAGNTSSGAALAAVTDGQIGAHGQVIRPRVGRRFELSVYTDDGDRAIDSLRSREVPVPVEPVDQPNPPGETFQWLLQ